jgi:hypothetical protein
MGLKKGGEVFSECDWWEAAVFSRLICGGSLPPKGGSREPWNRRKDFAAFPGYPLSIMNGNNSIP